MKKPKPIKQILSTKGSSLGNLIRQSSQLNHINQELAHLLPYPLSFYCVAVKLEGGTLTIIADSPAWASRARFQSKQIVKALNIKSVVIKTAISTQPTPTPPKRQASMSSETANLLIQLADDVSDPKLKEAIHRLSQRKNKQ